MGFLVFTGPFEVHYKLDHAEERMVELLNEGHNTPHVVKVEVDGGGNPTVLKADILIDVALPEENGIR